MSAALRGRIAASMEAFACGDAMGMPTEFMTLPDIRARFGLVDRLLHPEESQNHADLPQGAVTDDTEQNLYLLAAYRADGAVTVENTAAALLRWVRETDAVAKKYIGPSSKSALEAVEAGADPHTTGLGGTTCGGVMRVPSVVWFDAAAGEDALEERVVACLMPTHFTSQALEAAGAYAFALRAALLGAPQDAVRAAAARGAARCMARAPYIACAPSAMARVEGIARMLRRERMDDAALLDFLYGFCGTGLPSADVCAAAFALYLCAGGSAWRAIRLGASAGGDTDTIAALSGALTAAHSGALDVPEPVRARVRTHNGLDYAALAGEES